MARQHARETHIKQAGQAGRFMICGCNCLTTPWCKATSVEKAIGAQKTHVGLRLLDFHAV
jgi:hypothetical protein